MVDKQGLVKVIGMGLARLDVGEAADSQAEQEITMRGQAMGSCDFIAPEQAADAHSVDPRADVYSLGCTLHALLTGKPPYVGKSPLQQALAHRSSPIPSLRAARPDVPEVLDAVFQKMLAKKPEDRYASMAEVQAALQESMSVLGLPGQDVAATQRQHGEQAFNALLKSLGQEATITWCPTLGQQAGPQVAANAEPAPAGSQAEVPAAGWWARVLTRLRQLLPRATGVSGR